MAGHDGQRLGNRRVGLAQVAHELAVLLPDAPVRRLVLLERGGDHAGQHAAALLQEEVGQAEGLAAEVLVDAAHHVGQRVAGVALQQVLFHPFVGGPALPRLQRARKIVAAEMKQGVRGFSGLAGDVRLDLDVSDPQRGGPVGRARLVEAAHA